MLYYNFLVRIIYIKLHLMGKYSGNEQDLPQREHEVGAVKFKEPENMKSFSKIISLYSVIISIVAIIIIYIRTNSLDLSFIGILLSALCMLPHELLHAIVFKSDVYLYSNLKSSMLFIVGTEDMSKTRFIFMSLLPNLVFGLIPFIIFLIDPTHTILGTLGAVSISMGAGDYYNILSAIKQMPKGSRTYLCGMNSYWYMP